MLDIRLIRENSELVAEKSKQKGYQVDIPRLLELDVKRRELLAEIEKIRSERNEIASSEKGARPSEQAIERGKQLKTKLENLEKTGKPLDEEFTKILDSVPNIPTDDTPVGDNEDQNQVVKEWGEKPNFDFKPKTHWQIGEARDWIDKERAVKVAGSRFAYIKGELVQLQFALIQFGMSVLGNTHKIKEIADANNLEVSHKPFIPVLPPALVRTEPYQASGRLNASDVTYKLADDELWLNASAEHSLCSMYMDEILNASQLPLRYVGYATSFRREAGTYGKDTDGILRMHQFDKLEMESFTSPEDGLKEHLLMVGIQEYLVQQLRLPYQLLLKCTADIGFPNARGVDINTWMPGQDKYRETHSADFISDFQARGLRTRVRGEDGSVVVAHTNDATAYAMGRMMIAIIENYQTADGHLIVPDVLRPFMGGVGKI